MSKQTTIEWLVEKLKTQGLLIGDPNNLVAVQQALDMDIEQKKFMFDCGRQYQLTGEGTFTEVYNETYKNE